MSRHSLFFALLNSILVQNIFAKCNSDNCLRAILASPNSASAFCHTYTVAPAPSLPAFVSACSASPSKLSSACSCIGSSTSTMTTSPTTTSHSTTSPSSSVVSPTCYPASTVTITSVSISKLLSKNKKTIQYLDVSSIKLSRNKSPLTMTLIQSPHLHPHVLPPPSLTTSLSCQQP